MKQLKIIQAYKDLELLSDIKDYHSQEQWALYVLRKELRSSVEFYKERTEAIMEKYREFANDDGVIKGQPYQDYLKDINDLNNLDIEIEFNKIVLPFVDGISFKLAESLEDFVEFKSE